MTVSIPRSILPACHPSLVLCLSSLKASLPSVSCTYCQYLEALPSQSGVPENESRVSDAVSGLECSAAGAVPDVPGYRSCVHTRDHGGSEAPDGLPDSILSSEPKPLRKHRPPPPPSMLSPGDSATLALTSPKVSGAISGTLSAGSTQVSLIPSGSRTPRSHIWNLEWTDITSCEVAAWTREDHPYGQQVVIRHPDDGSNGDGTGGGDECADEAMHLARYSPAKVVIVR
ncbi:hypothetical protein Tco_0605816 [Tanacetum coccineum]